MDYLNDDESTESHHTWSVMGAGVITAPSHLVLSEGHLALHTAFVQVHTNLFGICPSGFAEAWTHQGLMASCQENPSLPPLGRLRLRSRSLTHNTH
jgi:hypothetical protein